jgi:hypothetical protein
MCRWCKFQGFCPETFRTDGPADERKQNPAISEMDLLGLPLPDIDDSPATSIASASRAPLTARQRARNLLDVAQRAVEIAIKNREAAALAKQNNRSGLPNEQSLGREIVANVPLIVRQKIQEDADREVASPQFDAAPTPVFRARLVASRIGWPIHEVSFHFESSTETRSVSWMAVSMPED